MSDTKVCNRCKLEQPRTQFATDRKMKDGKKNQCYSCKNKDSRAARAGSPRVTHTGLTPPKQLRAVANRNALLTLIRRHPEEFDMLVTVELKRLKELDKDPAVKKTWISAEAV